MDFNTKALAIQATLGLINGSFYAMLSLGLAVIFGMLGVINFAHGALYMVGAFVAWMLLTFLGVDFWFALVLSPVIVGLLGILIHKTMLERIAKLDPLYGLLLTFGLALVLEGIFRHLYGVSGQPYPTPPALVGATSLGYMMIPTYRLFVVVASLVICFGTWYAIERTKLGSYLRAATEKPQLTQAFGINVPLLVTLCFGVSVALAGVAGVLAAPIYQVNALMGSNLIIIVFAVVVIGGMGSILGAVVTGFLLGFVEGATKVFYPEAANIVIFVIMAIVLLVKPAGLFGRAA